MNTVSFDKFCRILGEDIMFGHGVEGVASLIAFLRKRNDYKNKQSDYELVGDDYVAITMPLDELTRITGMNAMDIEEMRQELAEFDPQHINTNILIRRGTISIYYNTKHNPLIGY